MPKFSIILPVKNGGDYIHDCLASILGQVHDDFEVIILENCSSDGTAEWLSAIRDPRVKVLPALKPLTIEENWQRVLGLNKSEFITLIGHDDLLHPHYLKEMEALILKYPDATLYQSHFNYIDSKGAVTRDCLPMKEKEDAISFLQSCLRREIDLMGTGFMMRATDYNAVGGIPDYPNLLFADFELWLNLTIKGYKATSSSKCFSFRVHQSTTTTSGDSKMHHAFKQFIDFLNQLQVQSDSYRQVISTHAGPFLEQYCQGFVHRLLRTPVARRDGITVRSVIDQFYAYAVLLHAENTFQPQRNLSVKLALLIDRTSLGRRLFLLFKRIFPKPVLR